ncbi:MAG: prepilin-type N-terminal cleavage/methylation domain-containing protein [Planctomycetota bacterium]|nr:prepilin-type N-terminal cleavage/methylation domain-containing protein [Planctomycetota bacterium]
MADASRPRPGFTLVELLVVIAIVILAMSMIVGGLSDLNQRRRLGNSASSVTTALAFARSQAISERSVIHVRIENLGPGDQRISVYRFPKTSDALDAVDELAVQTLKGADGSTVGWNDGATQGNYSNYRLMSRELEPGTWFETEYDSGQMWDTARGRPKPLGSIHAAPSATLYYGGTTDPASMNLLPKVLPNYSAYTQPTHVLLSYYPDGTASANVLLFIRDERALKYVQVWRGGMVRAGDVTKLEDFAKLD